MNCYENDTWQTRIKTKEHIMKSGLSSGSEQSVSKQSGNPSVDHWGESIQEILNSNCVNKKMVGEVKYRDKSNFPSPFKVLEGRDIAFYKRRRGTPQTLVIMSGEVFEKLMENSNGNSNKINQSPS